MYSSDSEEELCKSCPKGYTTAGTEATSIDQCNGKIYVLMLIKCVKVCNRFFTYFGCGFCQMSCISLIHPIAHGKFRAYAWISKTRIYTMHNID